MVLLNGYKLAEDRDEIKNLIDYLKDESDNTAETVLLTNEEIKEIIHALAVAEECINFRLKRLVERIEDYK